MGPWLNPAQSVGPHGLSARLALIGPGDRAPAAAPDSGAGAHLEGLFGRAFGVIIIYQPPNQEACKQSKSDECSQVGSNKNGGKSVLFTHDMQRLPLPPCKRPSRKPMRELSSCSMQELVGEPILASPISTNFH
uniref:Uncharacterized protein n=1 Tax=Oryza glumipatula TaxID=40148 RepID=A0A0E0ADN5_9ORYZ